MCGISALYNPSGNKQAQEKFLNIWVLQESRGRDATGIFAVVRRGENTKLLYAKYPIPASIFVPYISDYIQRHDYRIIYAIAHARAATHGSPSRNVNNHPILRLRGDGIVTAIVHNGVVNEHHCDRKVSETDTEELLCKYMNSGIERLYPVSGSATVGILDIGHNLDIKFYVARYINPLSVSTVDDALVFGSIGADKYIYNSVIIDLINKRYMKYEEPYINEYEVVEVYRSGLELGIKPGDRVKCYTATCDIGKHMVPLINDMLYSYVYGAIAKVRRVTQPQQPQWRPLNLDEITTDGYVTTGSDSYYYWWV